MCAVHLNARPLPSDKRYLNGTRARKRRGSLDQKNARPSINVSGQMQKPAR